MSGAASGKRPCPMCSGVTNEAEGRIKEIDHCYNLLAEYSEKQSDRIKEIESEVERLKKFRRSILDKASAHDDGAMAYTDMRLQLSAALALNGKLIAALEKAKADQTQLAKNYAPDEPMHRESWMHEAHGRIDDALAEARKR